MSAEDIDPHTLCHRCRGQKCSEDKTCSQCNTWDPPQWKKYEARKTYAARQEHTPKTPKTPIPEKTSPLPPKLTKEKPFDEDFVTPVRPKPVLPPVPPTPVTRLQQETQQRFLSLETSFEAKMEAMMVKSMAERPVAQHVVVAENVQPPRPPVIHVVDGEKVDILVEEKDEEVPPEEVRTLVVWESPIPQSTTSKALAAARRATASASVLLGPTQRTAEVWA